MMFKSFLKSKIHMAKVTETKVNYEGSITIDKKLATSVHLLPNEKVLVADVNNGNRFETYVIYGEKGEICINGAAANLVNVGDRVIIMAFACSIFPIKPKIIRLNDGNNILK